MNFTNPEGQIARWLEILGTYDFKIEHRAGIVHSNADALSRRPCLTLECTYYARAENRYEQNDDISNDSFVNSRHISVCKSMNETVKSGVLYRPASEKSEVLSSSIEEPTECVEKNFLVDEAQKLEDSCEFVARESKINVSARVVNTRSGAKDKDNESTDDEKEIDSSEIGKERIVELQHLDVNIKVVLDLKEKGVKPAWSDISKYSPEDKYYWNHWDSMYVKNNILFRKFENEPGKETICQIVLPKTLRKFVLKQVHDSVTGGHLGITKTLSKVTSRFFWHKMRKNVEVWCKTCDLCASRKMPQKKPKAPMKQYNVGAPLERVAVDIMGPFPRTPNGNKYIMVVGDYFSKWMQAFTIKELDAVTVARKLVDQFVTILGVPLQIHSD